MTKPKLWLVIVLAIFCACAGFLLLLSHAYRTPRAPTVPVVSACKDAAGTKRLGERSGLQFDVATDQFTFHEGVSDAAPFTHGFDVKLKNSKSSLRISFGPHLTNGAPIDPARTFSAHVEKRTVFNDKGRAIGQDEWGYLRTGERWRRVTFGGSDVAEYGLVDKGTAELLDRVISSRPHGPQSVTTRPYVAFRSK